MPSAANTFKRLLTRPDRPQFVTFATTCTLGSVDIIYSNASLHYAESLDPFLETVKTLKPKWLLLDAYLANQTKAFYLTQHVYGSDVAVAIRSLSDSLDAIREVGYSIDMTAPMLGPVQGSMMYGLPLDHFGAPFMKTFRYSILAHLD